MQLGYSTWGMPDTPIDIVVPHLARLGFDGIEITVLPRFATGLDKMDQAERRRIPLLLRQHDLTLSALGSFLSMMEPDPERFAANLTQLHGAIDLAAEWFSPGQTPIVITGFGGQPGDLEQQTPQLVERLNRLGDYAQAQGVTVALEPHIGNAVETPDQAVALMQQVTSPAIRINFDISHFNILGIPIQESVTKLLPYSPHTHVKDEKGRYPNFEFVIPGEGEFDYVAYLQEMQTQGYQGFVSAEISFMVQKRPDYDPLATAAISYEVLNRAFVEAGVTR